MAGSYKHVVNKRGELRSPETWLLGNLGDCYEAVEEMYGMIWYLAKRVSEDGRFDGISTPAQFVEEARQGYREGLESSPGVVRD